MRSVLLAGPSGYDPAGKRAVHDAMRAALPGLDVVDIARLGRPARLMAAARRSVGVVVAGASLTPSSPASPAAILAASPPLGRASFAGDTPPSVATMAALSGAVQRPLAVVGLSTGPLGGRLQRMICARVARRADLLLMEDEESARHLAAAGAPLPLRVAADPAWAVLGPPAAPTGSSESVVVVVDGRADSTLEEALAVGLEGLSRTGRRIRLMPWAGSGTGDRAVSWRLACRLRSATSVPADVETAPDSLPEAVERMSDASLVVALRYRALQAAAAAGVPVAAVAVEGRIAALAARLGQTVIAPAELARALPLLAGRIPARSAGPDRIAEELARAHAGLDLLRLVLEPSQVGADELNCLPLVPVPWLS